MPFEIFLKLLRTPASAPSPHFIISTHKFCDGDGLGAGLALYHGLRHKGQKASFFTLEKPHPKYKFMDNRENIIKVFDEKTSSLPKNSVLVFVDVNDISLVKPLYRAAKQQKCEVFFIDHHPLTSKKAVGDYFFIDSKASSTAEIIYLLLKKMAVPINEAIAVGLFTSIVFDTNLFRYIKNSSAPFVIASEIAPKIKDINFIYESLFKTLTPSKLHFMGKLSNMEYHHEQRIAFLHLKKKDFEEYKTDATQAYELMDIARNVDTVESTALIMEQEDGSCKLSLRSAAKDLIPLAKKFNGGGHAHSAGATLPALSVQQLKDIKQEILSYLK